MKDRPRHVAVLKSAAERAGWGQPLPEGTALGIANALFSLTGMRQRSTPLNLG